LDHEGNVVVVSWLEESICWQRRPGLTCSWCFSRGARGNEARSFRVLSLLERAGRAGGDGSARGPVTFSFGEAKTTPSPTRKHPPKRVLGREPWGSSSKRNGATWADGEENTRGAGTRRSERVAVFGFYPDRALQVSASECSSSPNQPGIS